MAHSGDYGPGTWASIGGGVIGAGAVCLVVGGFQLASQKDPDVVGNGWILAGLILAGVGLVIVLGAATKAFLDWWRSRRNPSGEVDVQPEKGRTAVRFREGATGTVKRSKFGREIDTHIDNAGRIDIEDTEHD